MGVQMKEYGGKVAEDIRLLLIGRTLADDRLERIQVINGKKSRNKIDIYIGLTKRGDIQIIKEDLFIASKEPFKLKSKEKRKINRETQVLHSLKELHDYIIKTYIL